MTPDEAVQAVAAELDRHEYRYIDEYELQDGVEKVLADIGGVVTREVHLAEAGRIDVLVAFPTCRVGVEVKVDGRAASVRRQLTRYADSRLVDGLVLITNRWRHTEGLTLDIPLATVVATRPW